MMARGVQLECDCEEGEIELGVAAMVPLCFCSRTTNGNGGLLMLIEVMEEATKRRVLWNASQTGALGELAEQESMVEPAEMNSGAAP
ncbi:hypothetical protein DPX16_14446 [Anabarilius grahami]|uniref:Uncharacterized protein n=1 Tax=Anabarilius grahami TaxID=495550 RepID=A0A3N0YX71_ANAGA|nr:hypothetical protein DPX16_14446 [Anabarilius grahami]